MRRLFEGSDTNYYKPIKTDSSFDGGRNSYIEYKSRGDRFENLLPEEYLDMIRPYLRDLINEHKTPVKADKVINNDTKFGESKIQLVMLSNCISIKKFEETRSIYSGSKPTEIFMGSNTDDVIDKIFDTILQRFQKAQET